MDSAIVGGLGLFGLIHFVLIVVPLFNTLRAPISLQGKLFWCAFLVLLPIVGVVVFHFKFRSSVFQGEGWRESSEIERAKAGTLAPNDFD